MIRAEDVISAYGKNQSLRQAAKETGLSCQTVKRILITNGIYPSERAEAINRMVADGKSPQEIAERIEINPKSLQAHLPYTKGGYATKEPTANALRIRACRERRKG